MYVLASNRGPVSTKRQYQPVEIDFVTGWDLPMATIVSIYQYENATGRAIVAQIIPRKLILQSF